MNLLTRKSFYLTSLADVKLAFFIAARVKIQLLIVLQTAFIEFSRAVLALVYFLIHQYPFYFRSSFSRFQGLIAVFYELVEGRDFL